MITVFVAVVVALSIGTLVLNNVEDKQGIILNDITEIRDACLYNQYAVGLASLNSTSKGTLAYVSSDFVFSGSAGVGLDASNEMHYLLVDHNSRIRQEGTVKGIAIETDTDYNDANLTEFTISVWRKDGATFDRIGITGNIISDLKTASGVGAEHVIYFSGGDFISGVQEGDYVGFSFGGSGTPTLEAINAQGESSGISSYIRDGSAPASVNHDWEAETSDNDWANIRLLMDSPSIVFLGQSITAGNLAHEPYLKESSLDAPTTTISYKVGNVLGVSTQNLGNAEATGAAYVLDGVEAMANMMLLIDPKILVISYGNNDSIAETPLATFESRLQSIVDDAQLYGMTPVLQKIYRGDAFESQVPYNNVIESIAIAEGISMIDPSPALTSQLNDSTCNLKIGYKSGYSSDGTHLTELGNNVTATFLLNPEEPYTYQVRAPVAAENIYADANQTILGAVGLFAVVFIVIGAVVVMRVVDVF